MRRKEYGKQSPVEFAQPIGSEQSTCLDLGGAPSVRVPISKSRRMQIENSNQINALQAAA